MGIFGIGWRFGTREAPARMVVADRAGGAAPASDGEAVEEGTRIDYRADAYWWIPLIGLVSILLATVTVIATYRYFAVGALTEHVRDACLGVANAAMEATHEDLERFLADRRSDPQAYLPPAADDFFHELLETTNVKSMRIYGLDDRLAYANGVPGADSRNQTALHVATALAGDRSSSVWYADMFSPDAEPGAPRNNVVAWLPINDHSRRSMAGVLEITTDFNDQVVLQERNQLLLGISTLLILLALYIAFLIGWRALEKGFARRQETLNEQADRLPEMFRRSLSAAESVKRRLAAELHEQVAQTLVAVKMNVERAVAEPTDVSSANQLLTGVVTPLQSTIREIREVASSLDSADLRDFGLCIAIENLFAVARQRRPQSAWMLDREVTDDDVPEVMRPIVHRLIEDALEAAMADAKISRFQLLLGTEDGDLVLRIRDDAGNTNLDDRRNPYAKLRELTLLSGGRILCRHNSWGGIVMRIAWPLADGE